MGTSGMRRRRFLRYVTVGSIGGLSGCSGRFDRRLGSPDDDGGGTPPVDPDDTSLAAQGNPPTICQEDISDDPGIYAITEPAFAADWSGIMVDRRYRTDSEATGLVGDQTVIGLAVGDRPRAYPVSVLWSHEIVNDKLDRGDDEGEDAGAVLVTFCPLCRSGLVASRVLGGEATTFAVSGLLWKAPRIQEAAAEMDGRVFGAETTGGETLPVRHSSNLVMYDFATRSYWSQIIATAICGPLEGETLDIVPSTVSTWAEWQRNHPDTDVLLPPPHSETTKGDG